MNEPVNAETGRNENGKSIAVMHFDSASIEDEPSRSTA